MRIASLLMAGVAAFGLALGAAAVQAQEEEGTLPDVEAPDFADAGAVLDSVSGMLESIEGATDAEGWRVLRAETECRAVEKLIEEKTTSEAYEAASGENLWTMCHDHYESLQLH
jgi:hypothetical protein